VTGRRLIAACAVGAALALALGIRATTGGAVEQHSGTALYASMIYAGAFVIRPAARPGAAGAAAIAFCWLVEFLQLTGVPAYLSERSLLARLALGVQFDPVDLAWYVAGVLPLAVLHQVVTRRNAATADA
jgi:hypothetical protein